MTGGPWRSATAGGGGAAGGRGPAELGQVGREAAFARAGLKGWRRPAAARVGWAERPVGWTGERVGVRK
jgi:hypothetical protein